MYLKVKQTIPAEQADGRRKIYWIAQRGMMSSERYLAAVVGAGPAGLFAARELATNDVHVVVFNRDIKPGGLAEYGIYPDKHRIKEGLRSQFRLVLSHPGVEYIGNLTIGTQGELRLDELRGLGFQAVLVAAGAQGTKWLGMPGEDLKGVYHAKDIVFHYNHLPPYSQMHFEIGRRVAVVGVGNVALDITRYLATLPQVEDVVAVARRGPGEVKFSRGELEEVAGLLDMDDLDVEIERCAPLMRSLDENPDDFMDLIHLALQKARQVPSHAHFTLRFLAAPRHILGDDQGRVCGLEVEDTTLVLRDGEVSARSLGTLHTLAVDTVIFAIGDRVDERLGLPVLGGEFVKCPQPRFPVEGVSYEVCNPPEYRPLEGFFVAGWSRKASSGLVGVARRDGVAGAKAILQYLQTLTPLDEVSTTRLRDRLRQVAGPLVTKTDLARLEMAERARAEAEGLVEFKFSDNAAMLAAMGLG